MLKNRSANERKTSSKAALLSSLPEYVPVYFSPSPTPTAAPPTRLPWLWLQLMGWEVKCHWRLCLVFRVQGSFSLPGSPYNLQRKGSKGSQLGWKKKQSNDRQPLVPVPGNIEALPLPFADDSAAVTPSSEDLCNSPFFLKNLPNGRRFSFAAMTGYRHPLAAGRPSSRRSSFGSQHSRGSRSSRHSVRSKIGGGGEKTKTEKLFFRKTNVPDVVLDTSKLADTVSGFSV